MKNVTKVFSQWLIVILAIGLASGCAMTTVREHPDFVSKTRQASNIAVLPADAEILYLVLTGDNERLPDDEKNIQSELSTSLPGLLAKRGYQARFVSTEELTKLVKDAGFTLEQAKSAYANLSKQLYERNTMDEDESKKIRVSIGPIGSALADALKVDAFLLSRYGGFKKSPGLISKDVVAGAMLGALTGVVVVPAATGGSLELALIDSHSGDVFWTNRGGSPALAASGVAKTLLNKLPTTGVVAEQEKAQELAKAEEAKAVAKTETNVQD